MVARDYIQIVVLITGTAFFSIIIYLLVQIENGQYDQSLLLDNYDMVTISETVVYNKPNNNSKTITILSAKTRVLTSSETKYFYLVTQIEGYKGAGKKFYILKDRLTEIK